MISEILQWLCAIALLAATLQRLDSPIADKLAPPADLQQGIEQTLEEAAENGFTTNDTD
jgi:cytosine/adenosine deaminase-related metal-dependent hydrolase